MKKQYATVMLAAVLAVVGAKADIFGTGTNQFTIDFVPVGSPGNVGEATPQSTGFLWRAILCALSSGFFNKTIDNP